MLILSCSNIFAEGIQSSSTESDARMLIERNNRMFQQEKLQKTLHSEKEKRKQGIENLVPKEEEDRKVSNISFVLKEIQVLKSEILTEQEIAEITNPYIEKEITTSELYTVVQKINELYEKKGYMVCRAVLPAQRIQNGVVQILLVEGKTGDITIVGNRSTREEYIRERLPLEKGKISNFKELERDLTRFNLTNDSALQVNMSSGKTPGTTDYSVEIYEPERQQFLPLQIIWDKKIQEKADWG